METDKAKILIVDDERFYINVLVDLLSEEYHTIVTKDSEQVIERALDAPDLILLDIMMPKTSGYDICRQLKSDVRTKDIPVIFLTVKSEIDDEIKGFELGAVDYITKPISPAIVKARVATHIELNRVRKDLLNQNDSLLIEQNKKDEQLRRSQKLEALGKLTGGIAHDFNNILGIVLGYSELLIANLESNEQLSQYARHIFDAGQRGQKITQKLLSFKHNKSAQAEIININDVLKAQQSVLQKLLSTRIKLVLLLDKQLWNTSLDKSDLEDALLNMCINAMHAMPEGGELILKTQNIILESSSAGAFDVVSGEYAGISVIDNGTGMTKQTQERIFDPFFTTKGEKGTGLGMSQVYSFTERSAGDINVKSVLNKGTEISLYFPRKI